MKFLKVILVVAVGIGFLVSPIKALAGPGLPFGGQVIKTIPCPCSLNLLVINRPIGPTSIPNLVFGKGSILYAFFNIFTPGNFILGTYTTPTVCAIPGPSGCTPPIIIPAMKIHMVGTSNPGGGPTSGLGGLGGLGGGGGSGGGSGSGEEGGEEEEQPPASGGKCAGKEYLISNEGWRNEPYIDSEGHLTVGVGHKVTNGESYNRTLSDAEVRSLYESDYAKAERDARILAERRDINFDSLSEGRQLVLVDMTFNMGAQGSGGLAGFNKMWDAVEKKDWDRAGYEITNSNYSSQVGERAARNREMMESGTTEVAEDYAAQNSRADAYCS